ncbi:MAG: EthD family reductase [Solirubrobacterales bacterium]
MIKLVGTWHIPDTRTPEKIGAHYFAVHVSNLRALPKLRRHVVPKATETPEGGELPTWRGAEVGSDNREDFHAAIASPEWTKIAADGFMPLVAGLETDVFEVEEEFKPDEQA